MNVVEVRFSEFRGLGLYGVLAFSCLLSDGWG
jgi:hypothetical protein